MTNAYANGIRALQQGRLQRALRFLRRAIRFTADMKEVFVEHATTNYGAQFFITGAPKEGDQQVVLKPAVFVASSSRSCLCLITLTGTVTVCQVMKLAEELQTTGQGTPDQPCRVLMLSDDSDLLLHQHAPPEKAPLLIRKLDLRRDTCEAVSLADLVNSPDCAFSNFDSLDVRPSHCCVERVCHLLPDCATMCVRVCVSGQHRDDARWL